MKITITRSFSKKVQLRQFEPIDVFCSISSEHEEGTVTSTRDMSRQLDEFCREEVDKTLAIIRPPMKDDVGKGKNEKKEIAKTESELDAGFESLPPMTGGFF